MPGRRQLRRILFPTWPDMQALADEWKAFIERCDSWSWGPGFDVDDGDGGRTVNLKLPPGIKAAKCGGSDIPAMSGSTPGSGSITLHHFNGTSFVAGAADTARNMHPTETVTANAWIKVCRIDGHWFVFWEPCD